MGNRTSDAPYIGLLIPDDRIKTNNLRNNDGVLGNSDYTQTGPRPGVPVFDQAAVALLSSTAGDYSPSLSLETLGDQDAATSYHVKCLKGGFPGESATVVRRDSVTSGDWRGWNTANVLGHFHASAGMVRDSGANTNYTVCTTDDNQALVLYWRASILRSRKYNPETRVAAAEVDIVSRLGGINDDDGTYNPPPTAADNLVDAVVLPTGRVVAYYLTLDIDSVLSTVQLWAAYSDDHGVTWRTAQYLGLASSFSIAGRNLYRLRAAYSAGTVLLTIEKDWVAGATFRGFMQYASSDTGLNFTLVKDDETDSVSLSPSHGDILVDTVTGGFLFIYNGVSTTEIKAVRLDSAYTPYTLGATTVVVDPATPTHMAAYTSEDGAHYLTYDTADGITMLKSIDGGETWVVQENVWNWNDAEEKYTWDLTEAAGRVVWVMEHTAGSGTRPLGNTLVIQESGGWSTLCQPRIIGQDPTVNRGYGSTTGPQAGTWIATDAPEYFGWTRVGPAATPSAVAPFRLNLTGATHYTVAPTATVNSGLSLFFSFSLASPGAAASLASGLRLVLDTYNINLWFSSTQVALYDVHAGAHIGASPVTPGNMGTEHSYKLAIRQDRTGANAATLYRRTRDTDAWTTLITGTALTTGAPAANLIDWGNFNTQDSSWSSFHWVADSGTGDAGGYFDDQAQNLIPQSPFVLYGAPLPVPPFSRYLDKGLLLRGTSGPATRGDTWQIPPQFDHPVEALDYGVNASPARRWRSVGVGAATIAWGLGLASTLGNSSVGMFLGGINFATAELRGWNGAAWVTLATLEAQTGLTGLACVVNGDTVVVNAAVSVDARYISYGEFVGGHVKFNNGDIRRIVWNSEGSYTDRTTKRPSFRFEGNALGGAVATCNLWHPSALVILHENTTLYDRYALHIPAQTTAEGYFEVGTVIIGAMAMFGRKYARGRSVETTPNYSLTEDLSGARRGRKLGDTRRAVSMVWLASDLTAISGATPDPDYISPRAAANTPTADRHGAPLLVEGLLGRLGGGTVPVVYVPNIPETTPGNLETRMAARDRYVYGRIVGGVTRSAILGTEAQDEVVNLAGVRIEEEV